MGMFNRDRSSRRDLYYNAAMKMKEFLKTCQNNIDSQRGGGIGAVWGSWPISGGYGKYESLNWAAKYFVDLLSESLQNDSKDD